MIELLIFLIGLLFYASYGLTGLAYLAAVTVLSYLAGRLQKKLRWLVWPCVVLNVLALLLVKLQAPLGLSFAAPLGISYFTLQVISYHIDIHRGILQPERNFLRYGLFVSYFPHVSMGPIERYETMSRALSRRKICWDGISLGALRAVWGLAKKLIIASRLGVIIGAISADTEAFRGGYALCAMILYSLQLYCDFSGGIDTVLGVSRMLGLTLSENFDAPFLSQSFQEFWRRWHMTLGSWLRQYIYIPLGGNRKGKLRKTVNLLITFLVSGLWHGVDYILWGLFNGIFVAFGKSLQTKWKLLNRLATFLLVSLLWCFFIWPNAGTAMEMLASVFTEWNWLSVPAGIAAMGLTLGDWLVAAAALAALGVYDCRREAVNGWLLRRSPWQRTALLCALGLTVLVFGMYGIGFDAAAFIYSNF
ncbi:MAG: MBOAT family protein [Oscillospiraceae bacterium]|nr:MBOAT family protein [Oscillospiraceae bacterium]